jgi:hypothetical protein
MSSTPGPFWVSFNGWRCAAGVHMTPRLMKRGCVRGLLNARCYQLGAKIAVFVSAAQGLNTADLPNETLQVPAVKLSRA